MGYRRKSLKNASVVRLRHYLKAENALLVRARSVGQSERADDCHRLHDWTSVSWKGEGEVV